MASNLRVVGVHVGHVDERTVPVDQVQLGEFYCKEKDMYSHDYMQLNDTRFYIGLNK